MPGSPKHSPKRKIKSASSGASPKRQKNPPTVTGMEVPSELAAQDSLPRGKLTLKDGSVIEGISFGAQTAAAGEVVFNTGMVGYPEALTDPSYRGQILVLTYPLIGNYGVPPTEEMDDLGLPKYLESSKLQITGLVITDYAHHPSHYLNNKSLSKWLTENNVPALYGVDTRELTKKLRTHGSMLGKIEFGKQSIKFDDPDKRNLVAEVSRKKPQTYGTGPIKIVAIDCGMKNNIIRNFCRRGVEFKVVPWDWNLDNENFDGLFISNGPGNPEMVEKTINSVRKQLEKGKNCKPIFGICLGNQILGLAAGAKTYKMKFGNRGMNQPVIDTRTSLCYITPQNHGFALDSETLPKGWKPMFYNANDFSNEGIIHSYKPFFSVQFHPEATGGPTDTEFLFDMFLDRIHHQRATLEVVKPLPPPPIVKKVLLLGSGGLSIGQAGEFDYSGSQAIKALKEESIHTILINPNIATVQTSKGMADEVYFVPVKPSFVEEIIKKTRPDGILLQFGGQTALNCGIALRDSGVLAKYDVKVLGTPVDTILATEDRQIFADTLAEINEKTAQSESTDNTKEALEIAERIGYPVLVRSAFALGGLGSGFAHNPKELKALSDKALTSSSQVIIDKSLRGWKELEYEVVRDRKDNCITVCNMENFDPVGIHTGDSIVVAPSQTISNEEYFMLRKTAIKVVRHLGVVGECNIQYALDPNSNDFVIIEVNARLSRSSALASKATGYPLAYVACKLALGMALTDLRNSVTQITTACFEPAMDYCVVKMPRWDMRKFQHVSPLLGSAMKSVGEVMSIGRTFEEAMQKAIRMVDGGKADGFGHIFGNAATLAKCTTEQLDKELSEPSDLRLHMIAVALQRGYTVERIFELTKIDRWYLHKLNNISQTERQLKLLRLPQLTKAQMRQVKLFGFSDVQIGRLLQGSPDQMEVRAKRLSLGVVPYVKQIDTLAAEFPALTNYLYMTYAGSAHDVKFEDQGVMVLGCGAYRIGSSCEFDWCAVSAIRSLRDQGKKSIVVNYNPETVSTDYDECDRLYFEELSLERVLDIYQLENSSGVIVSVGGQIPNVLAVPLAQQKVNILGTSAASIDKAEDRSKFSAILDKLGVDQPRWQELQDIKGAKKFADEVGYPVLVRPSYVLSGAAMNVAFTADELESFLNEAADISSEHPVVVTQFIENAKEIEYDGVASRGKIVNYAISEHVENAGVHSGDATLQLPAQKLYVETLKRVKHIAANIASHLSITGPFNIQFLSKNNDVKVIECNLRASRSFPFVSKTFNTDFIALATRVMCGDEKFVRPARIDLFDMEHLCVKVPMFSFTRLLGADPILRVEMASTGEVASFGVNQEEAYLKGLLSSTFVLPKANILLAIGPLDAKLEFTPCVRILQQLGYNLWGTPGTVKFYERQGIKGIKVAHKPDSKNSPKTIDLIHNKKIDLLININSNYGDRQRNRGIRHSGSTSDDDLSRKDSLGFTQGYKMRRAAVNFNVGLVSNIKCAGALVRALGKLEIKANSSPSSVAQKFNLQPWSEYMRHSSLL